MRNLPVSEFMNVSLVTVSPDDTLTNAVALMERHQVHHLLVMEQGRMAGILSSADSLKLALLQLPPSPGAERTAAEALDIRVRAVMQTHVAVLRANTSLLETARALSLGGFHALPVLAIDGTPVGIVTSSDLICLLIDQIDRNEPAGATRAMSSSHTNDAALPLLLEVLRTADVYLHSGQSEQQHARLSRAVARAREHLEESDRPDP